jgi:hypothetical protein
MKKPLFFNVTIALFLSSCFNVKTKGSVTSIDGRYQVRYEVNNTIHDKYNNDCIMLSLFNDTGKYLSKTQTDVSMKSSNFGIGWLHNNDTLLLFNKEAGLHLYKIDSNKILRLLKITPELSKAADSIINRKY